MGDVRVVDGEESIEDIRRELSSLLKEEIETKTSVGVLEDHSDQFLADANAVCEEDDMRLVVSWKADPYVVNVVYEKPTTAVNADGEGLGMDIVQEVNEGQMQEIKDRQEEEEGVRREGVQEGDEDEDDDDVDEDLEEDDDDDFDDENDGSDQDEVIFEVTVRRENSENQVGLVCMAGLDNRLYVEQIFLEDSPPLNFASLTEAVQDRMYDFLDAIKLDDRFGFFMRRRLYKVRRVQAKRTLDVVLDLVALEDKQKPNAGKKKNKKHQ